MRVVLSQPRFRKALTLLNAVVKKKSIVDVFRWVKLRADKHQLFVQGTNGEVYLTILIPAEIEEEGEVCVEAAELLNAVKSIKAKYYELYTEDEKLLVKADNLTQILATKPVELFPHFPMPQFQASLPTFVLEYGIEKVGFAVAKEEEKGPLAHLYIDGRGGHVCFVGSDGHRLAVQKLDYEFNLKVKLYYKSLKLLKELLKRRYAEQVHIGYDDKFVYLINYAWTIAVRVLSETRYPLYEAVIPPLDTYDVVVKVLINDLKNALTNFTKLDKITFEFTDRKGFTIKAQDTEVLVKADVDGDIGFSIDFDYKHVKEFVDVVGAYTYIEARFKNKDDIPALFKVNDSYFYLLMPLIRKR